jgi:homoserine kinase
MHTKPFCAKLLRRKMNQATIRIPATSANLGPGFDCLGVALDLHNRVSVARGGTGQPDPMVMEAGAAYFRHSGREGFDFAWSIEGDIPRSRGLGSSVAVRLGILHGLNEIDGRPLDGSTLYRICADLEGHPDNAAPAAFGGFTAARPDGIYFRCGISPELRFVLLIPDHEVETDSSRGVLPAEINRADAVRSVAHAALITAAFASRDYHLLRGSMRDWLHEPYREKTNSHLRPAVEAGIGAGALGGYLSGSGSAVCCIALENAERIAEAMRTVLPAARTMILGADNTGVRAAN